VPLLGLADQTLNHRARIGIADIICGKGSVQD
jgi:hypothetical protein